MLWKINFWPFIMITGGDNASKMVKEMISWALTEMIKLQLRGCPPVPPCRGTLSGLAPQTGIFQAILTLPTSRSSISITGILSSNGMLYYCTVYMKSASLYATCVTGP